MGKLWTAEEDAMFKDLWKGRQKDETADAFDSKLARLLHRPKHSITTRRSKFGMIIGKKTFDKGKAYWEKMSEKYCSSRDAALGEELSSSVVQKFMRKYKLKFKIKPANAKVEIKKEDLEATLKQYGSVRACAEAYKVGKDVIYDRINKFGIDKDVIYNQFLDSIAPNQDKFLLRPYGDCMICCDAHIPFHSTLWLKRLCETGEKLGIRQLIFCGDFQDFDRLSYWAKVSEAIDITVRLEDELTAAEFELERLEKQFDKVYFIAGNHFNRLRRQLTFSMKPERMLGLIGRYSDERYIFSEFHDWCLLDDRIRVTHPKKARKADGTLARDIWIGCPEQDIVVAHRHRNFYGISPDGKHVLIEVGWLGDPKKMRYIQHVDQGSYYQWANGFVSYRDGKLELYTEENTNWSKFL